MIFTENMTIHLNGGSACSVLHYRVHRDGRETAITHTRRTDGAPKYLITDDVFHCATCGADFDRLAAKGVGLLAWLEEHTGHVPRAEGE